MMLINGRFQGAYTHLDERNDRHLLEKSIDGVDFSLCNVEDSDPWAAHWTNMNACDVPREWYCEKCVKEWIRRVGLQEAMGLMTAPDWWTPSDVPDWYPSIETVAEAQRITAAAYREASE